LKSLGPVFVAVFTLDLHLALLFLAVNIAFAFTLTALVFRGRPMVDRWLIFLGVAFLANVVGLGATSLFARTPIREVITFADD
jgi:hypothetical protein